MTFYKFILKLSHEYITFKFENYPDEDSNMKFENLSHIPEFNEKFGNEIIKFLKLDISSLGIKSPKSLSQEIIYLMKGAYLVSKVTLEWESDCDSSRAYFNDYIFEIFENDSEDYNISVSDKTGKEIFVSSCKTNDEAIQQLEKFANTLK